MTKKELNEYLESKYNPMIGSFKKLKDFNWQWREPCIDGIMPSILIEDDHVLVITHSLYENDKEEKLTYEEFIKEFY